MYLSIFSCRRKMSYFRFLLLFLVIGSQFLDGEEIPPQKNSESALPTEKQLFRQALDAYKKGNFVDSFELLREAHYQKPDSFKINYWMGRAAYKQGKATNDPSYYEESLFSYDRALVLKPDHSRVLFEKGKTLVALGSKERARNTFQQVTEDPTCSQKLKDAANKCLKILEPASQHSVYGVIIARHEWDSNATLGSELSLPDPLDEDIIRDPTQRNDRIHSLTGLLVHRVPTACEDIIWKNKALLYLQDHVRLNKDDLRLFKVSTGLMYYCGRHRLEGYLSYSAVQLDEQLYRNEREIDLRHCYRICAASRTKLRYRYTDRHHFASRGSSKTNTFGVSQFLGASIDYRPDEQDAFDLFGSVRHSKSPRDGDKPLAHYQAKITLSYYRCLSSRFSVDGSATLRYRRYRYTEPEYPTLKRRDRATIYRLGLVFKVSEDTSFLVDVETERNCSNYAKKDYTADRLSLGVKKSF